MTTARSPITTHVLDTSLGRPASGVVVALAKLDGHGGATQIGSGVTDDDGRLTTLLAPGTLQAGNYSLRFETGAYFESTGRTGFYPHAEIAFTVVRTDEHYHVPLLLNPFGYSTYRGS